ncbi:MAG: hypothetical protein GX492_13855, partial [Firmicutes bacterium]|nr:hypothetical protein [Bacillota bacterium]
GRDGTGPLIVEHTYVDNSGRRSGRQFGLYDALHVDSPAELTRRVHACGAAVGIQLTPAGAALQREGKADLVGVGRAFLANPA